jgi:hypothetical protein
MISVALQVYDDDPWLALRGDRQTRDRHITIFITAWHIIGVRLAFNEAHKGFSMDCIGANISTPMTTFLWSPRLTRTDG